MDLSTVLGMVGGIMMLVISIITAEGNLMTFWDPPAILIVVGGSITALLISYPLDTLKNAINVIKKAFREESYDVDRTIQQIGELAYTARRDGLLAMEKLVNGLENEFLKRGVLLLVDGSDPKITEKILDLDVENMMARHAQGEEILKTLGKFCPGFGMIGTLMGMVLMLTNLSDTETLGPSMGVALITTLYGAVLANMVFLPMAGKLKYKSEKEVIFKLMIVEGILAVQAGESPLMIEEKLKTFIEEKSRNKLVKDKSSKRVKVGLNEAQEQA